MRERECVCEGDGVGKGGPTEWEEKKSIAISRFPPAAAAARAPPSISRVRLRSAVAVSDDSIRLIASTWRAERTRANVPQHNSDEMRENQFLFANFCLTDVKVVHPIIAVCRSVGRLEGGPLPPLPPSRSLLA